MSHFETSGGANQLSYKALGKSNKKQFKCRLETEIFCASLMGGLFLLVIWAIASLLFKIVFRQIEGVNLKNSIILIIII